MPIIRQGSLFDMQDLYEMESSKRFEAVFSTLHIEPLLFAVRKKAVYGAPTELNYPAMIYALVARILERIPTIKDLIKRLTQDFMFHLDCGLAVIEQKEIPWSLVINIIKPEQEEKNHPQHHNYWKREALVNQLGILSHLPKVVNTPKCYKVEEKSNGSIWIWMEEIKNDNIQVWSEDDYAVVAKQLGIFNGAYLTDMAIPEYSWI
jgi:hypothetical protein